MMCSSVFPGRHTPSRPHWLHCHPRRPRPRRRARRIHPARQHRPQRARNGRVTWHRPSPDRLSLRRGREGQAARVPAAPAKRHRQCRQLHHRRTRTGALSAGPSLDRGPPRSASALFVHPLISSQTLFSNSLILESWPLQRPQVSASPLNGASPVLFPACSLTACPALTTFTKVRAAMASDSLS